MVWQVATTTFTIIVWDFEQQTSRTLLSGILIVMHRALSQEITLHHPFHQHSLMLSNLNPKLNLTSWFFSRIHTNNNYTIFSTLYFLYIISCNLNRRISIIITIFWIYCCLCFINYTYVSICCCYNLCEEILITFFV